MKRKPKKILFSTWCDTWLSYKKNYVKESTYASYSIIIYNHLAFDFSGIYLQDINHNMIQKYILDKLSNGRIGDNSGLSQKSVKDIMMVLKSIIKYAINQEVMTNINLDFTYPKNNKQNKLYTLSKKDQKKLTNYILENPTPKNIGILISLYSGIRIGELCALKWSDIDFKSNIIHINKTLQKLYLKDNNQQTTVKVVITPPKTINSNRDIPISKDFASIIKPLKINNKFYVITGTDIGTDPRNYRKYFQNTIKKLKIKTINFHGLRHTFATNCISLGIDYKTVSELLGHSNINTTLNLYVHPNINQKKKCMNLLWKNRI